MRTPLVVLSWDDRFYRAETEGKTCPMYVPAHRAEGSRLNPKTGKVESSWDVPETVSVRMNGFHPKKGKLDRIRRIDELSVKALEALDAEREALYQKLREIAEREKKLLYEAYRDGVPVTLKEVKLWSEAELARRKEELAKYKRENEKS